MPQRMREPDEVIKHRWILGVLVCLVLACAMGCQKEVMGTQGEAVQEKGAPIAVTLEKYSLERVEVEGPNGPLIYDKPVLVVDLKFENTGSADFFYQPTHNTDKASNQQAPLLFVDPGPEGELTQNIPGIFLEEGLLAGQQSAGVKIEPGGSLTDRYLFTPPEQDNLEMALTVPASLHGGKKPFRIKLSYTKPNAPERPVHKQGDAIAMGEAVLTVTGAEVLYVPLNDSSSNSKGFSKDPVVKVSYKIENKGKEDLVYNPNHKGTGEILAPSLVEAGGSGRYMRVRFGADRDARGQILGNQKVAAGASVTDFAVFERPPEGVSSVRLLMPGKVLGQEGLARVDVPYTWSDPKKPAELTPKKPEEEP